MTKEYEYKRENSKNEKNLKNEKLKRNLANSSMEFLPFSFPKDVGF